jgi:hypothetical protein
VHRRLNGFKSLRATAVRISTSILSLLVVKTVHLSLSEIPKRNSKPVSALLALKPPSSVINSTASNAEVELISREHNALLVLAAQLWVASVSAAPGSSPESKANLSHALTVPLARLVLRLYPLGRINASLVI